MKTFKVYLAGAITGQNYAGANDWREYAKKKLAQGDWVDGKPIDAFTQTQGYYNHSGIYGYSPMRAKGYLERMVGMPEHHKGEVKTPLSQILNRDHWDCKTADAILVNLLGAERVSIGTVMEIAWAYAYRVPTVLVAKEDDIHRHGMVVASVGWHTTDLDDGIQMIKDILLP